MRAEYSNRLLTAMSKSLMEMEMDLHVTLTSGCHGDRIFNGFSVNGLVGEPIGEDRLQQFAYLLDVRIWQNGCLETRLHDGCKASCAVAEAEQVRQLIIDMHKNLTNVEVEKDSFYFIRSRVANPYDKPAFFLAESESDWGDGRGVSFAVLGHDTDQEYQDMWPSDRWEFIKIAEPL